MSGFSASKALDLPSGFTSLNQFERVTIQAIGQAIWYRQDSGTASTSNGNKGAVGDVITIEDPSSLRIIEDAASATVQVTYFYRAGSV